MSDPRTAQPQPWQWPEATWRGIVHKVRAGRSLKPRQWKGGARVAVALSFDSDHESITLREGEFPPRLFRSLLQGPRRSASGKRERQGHHDDFSPHESPPSIKGGPHAAAYPLEGSSVTNPSLPAPPRRIQ